MAFRPGTATDAGTVDDAHYFQGRTRSRGGKIAACFGEHELYVDVRSPMVSWSWSFNYIVPIRRIGPILALFGMIGAAFLSVGIYIGLSRYLYFKDAIEVPGEVVSLQYRSGVYYPLIRYTDRAGHARTLHPSSGTNPPSFFEGQKVVVMYIADDPAFAVHATVKSFWQMWGAPVLFSALGSVWLIFIAMFGLASISKNLPRKKSSGVRTQIGK